MSDEASKAAWQATGQIGSAGVAAIGQSVSSKKQYERSRALMDLQMQNQERMNNTAYMRQLQFWKDTNYGAQLKELKKAGMSVGLMYGGSGGGGTTVGNNSAGSAASGQVPSQAPFDIGAIVAASKAASELALMKAQTKKTEEEAQRESIENDILEETAVTRKLKNTNEYQEETGKQNAFLQDEDMYIRKAKAEIENIEIQTVISKAIKNGTISENEVKAYKAKLAKAEIDPDSNPVIREMMKAMAAEGKPLNEIIRKIVRFFID